MYAQNRPLWKGAAESGNPHSSLIGPFPQRMYLTYSSQTVIIVRNPLPEFSVTGNGESKRRLPPSFSAGWRCRAGFLDSLLTATASAAPSGCAIRIVPGMGCGLLRAGLTPSDMDALPRAVDSVFSQHQLLITSSAGVRPNLAVLWPSPSDAVYEVIYTHGLTSIWNCVSRVVVTAGLISILNHPWAMRYPLSTTAG